MPQNLIHLPETACINIEGLWSIRIWDYKIENEGGLFGVINGL